MSDMNDLLIGAAPAHRTIRERIVSCDKVFFCDLSRVDLSGLRLSGRHFFGCLFSATNLEGSRFERCKIEHCFVTGKDALPRTAGASFRDTCVAGCNFAVVEAENRICHDEAHWSPRARRVMTVALEGGVETLRDALLGDLSEERQEREGRELAAMSALLASFLLHPEWETRRCALLGLAEIVARRPEWLEPYKDVYLTFMMYRAGDESDGVFYDAVHLVKDLNPSDPAVRHVLGRIASEEPAERREGISGVQQLLGTYDYRSLLRRDALFDLLREPEPRVVETALQVVRDLVRQGEDLEDEPALASALAPLLRHPEPDVRLSTLSTVKTLGRWAARERLYECLADENAEVRREAYSTLYWILPQAEIRGFLERHRPPDRESHEEIVADLRYVKDDSQRPVLVEDDELRSLLKSRDPRDRQRALYLLSFLDDASFVPEMTAGLRDGDAEVRSQARETLSFLSKT